MRTIFIITFCLLSSYLHPAVAQTFADFNKMKPAMDVDNHRAHYSLKGETNEVKVFFKGLFIFYKSFISSQDGNSCSFTPSCSEYGLQAIQKKGLFIGTLATFDRLTRCNGLSPENYSYDAEKHLLIDPVQ